MNIRRLLLLACLVSAPPSHAQDRLFLAGGEYSDAAYYTYSGLILPGPGPRENGRGFVQRYWVDWFGYQYDGAPGRVDAEAYGLEAALGYGTSSATGWGTASVGARFTNTHLSPDDPSATARGRQWGLKVQLEGEQDLAPSWRAGAIASYTAGQGGYWGRLRVMRRAGDSQSFGGEAIANGNSEAHSTAVGLVYAVHPRSSKWSVNLKAGYRFQADADGAYGGLELGYGF
jgi:Cellulose biosynthesis protein BcsS